ncbi:glycosyltransferase family 2 protein [Pediococcus pentosaceus]|uniref:glycosyltransferase family 2 protein n=1 Tax=Pediococcus pentosaceus TaxID=1255 RepID=UPI00223B77B4|nr:glycosyltransferase family 2 protein [Pediococcus pentosaceus]
MFSIIIPTFNSADTILETLESVIKTKEKKLEIIIADDGSTDDTVEIINSKRIPNLKILNCSHMGPANIKNFAMEQVNGEYVCFLDSDDLIEKDYFRVLRKNTVSNPDLLVFDYITFNDGTDSKKSNQKVSLTMFGMGTMIWNKVYSINLIKKIRFPKDTVFEDVGFSSQALLLSKNPLYINKSLYCYRQRFGSITKNPHKPVSTHLDVIKGFEELFSFIANHNLSLPKDRKKDLSILVNNNLIMHIRKIISLYDIQDNNVKLTIKKLLKFKDSTNDQFGKCYSFLFSDKTKDNLKFQAMFFLIKIRLWKLLRIIILKKN